MTKSTVVKIIKAIIFYIFAFIALAISSFIAMYGFETQTPIFWLFPLAFFLILFFIKRKKILALIILTCINLYSLPFVNGVISYCVGEPHIYKFVYFRSIEDRNPDPYYRMEFRDSDDGGSIEKEAPSDMQLNNFAVKKMFEIFGYAPGAYTGYYPTRDEAGKIYCASYKNLEIDSLHGWKELKLKIDSNLTIIFNEEYSDLASAELINTQNGKHKVFAVYKYDIAERLFYKVQASRLSQNN